MSNVSVYVFSSNTITNIWAGYGSRTWAVSDGSDAYNKGRKTKARSMPVGSFGLLYCVPQKSFTTPFVTTSQADGEKIVQNIWPEKWVLPFSFEPLASPDTMLRGADLYELLPGMKSKGIENYSNYLKVQGNFAFQTSEISKKDWAIIVGNLVGSPRP